MPSRIARIATLIVVALSFLAMPTDVVQPSSSTASTSFLETFDGEPASPQQWRSPNWDVSIYRRHRDSSGWYALEEVQADHGPDCGAPPATHLMNSYEGAVYQCRNHLMTAIKAGGRASIYLTPNQLVDFSKGEAVVRFDMSTWRNSGRDWIELHLTPYHQHLQMPHTHPPRGIRLEMSGYLRKSVFTGYLINNFEETQLTGPSSRTSYEQVLQQSPTRRDTFELRISRTHIKFGMPAYNLWWIDTPVADLGWDQAVFQIGHYSYNPEKYCDGCGPTTWHWDNVSISPALPVTLIKADRRYADKTAAGPVSFSAPAPENAYLRFTGVGEGLSVSYDGGRSWRPARAQPTTQAEGDFNSYWMPIPAGVQQVLFRGESWHIRDISIWAADPEQVPGALESYLYLPALQQ